MTITATDTCTAARHGTAAAYRYDKCRCPDAVADMRIKKQRWEAATETNRRVRQAVVIPTELPPAPPGDEWRKWSACRDEDPELFFPLSGQTSRPAKMICRRCPVAGECLQDSVDDRGKVGVWGGYSDDERNVLQRKGQLEAAVAQLRARTADWVADARQAAA